MAGSTKLITPLAILSYPHLDQPQKADEPGKQEKYSAALIFTPEVLAIPAEKALFDALQKAALAVIEAKWPGKVEQLLKSDGFKKGFRRDAKDGYPEGSIYINARSEQKPGCVYAYADPATGKPARVPDEKIREVFYPGAVVRASVGPFAFDRNGNRGLSFGLNNLQFIKDGPRIDGRAAPENEFTADLSEAPASLEDLI